MSTIQGIITGLSGEVATLDGEIAEHWGLMMKGASIRGVLRAKLQTTKLMQVLQDSGSEERKAKRYKKRLSEFLAEIQRIEAIELSSKTYIKQILAPLKTLREDFASWVKGSDLSKILGEDDVKYILKKATRVADAKAKAIEKKVEEFSKAA